MSKKNILLVNWVQFDNPDMVGGGVSVYLRNSIPILLDKGYKVTFLSSGMHYDIVKRKPYIEATKNIFSDRGVTSYQVINSPIKAPAHDSFDDLNQCLDEDGMIDLVLAFIQKGNGFDEIHLHNIEGISTKLVGMLKMRASSKVIVWLHNYHWVCPQIELFKDGKERCENYNDGVDCVGCWEVLGHD